MLTNKQLKQLVHNHIDNNDSKEYLLGVICGLFVGKIITKIQVTDMQSYIDFCYK